jgi:hypothetical protein
MARRLSYEHVVMYTRLIFPFTSSLYFKLKLCSPACLILLNHGENQGKQQDETPDPAETETGVSVFHCGLLLPVPELVIPLLTDTAAIVKPAGASGVSIQHHLF